MIIIKKLEKKYGSLQALESVDVEIAPGRITAVLGPNGAGKTTLIKSILGLVKPDNGQIYVDGVHVNGDDGYRRMIGYMPQLARYPENLTVGEIVEMICDIRGRAGTEIPNRSESVSDPADADIRDDHVSGPDWDLWHLFKLESEKNKMFRTLSGGNRQKVSAVLAFLFRPRILFLDEPTAGLDPVSSSILKDKILKERDRGATIILTSHIMSEVQELAQTVVYLLEGKLHFEREVEDILAETGQKTLERAIASKLSASSWDDAERIEFSKSTEKMAAGGVL